MFVFASIAPHPPIIIPKIGGPETKRVAKTIEAMEKLRQAIEKTKPEVLLVISPHLPIDWQRMTIYYSKELKGDFGTFGAPDLEFSFQGEKELSEKMVKESKTPTSLKELSFLDHGSLVPLYFLASAKLDNLPLVPIAFSDSSLKNHFKFGRDIGKVIKKYPKRVAVVASGDLSHRLTPDAPAGYSPRGKEFDEKLVELLKKKDVNGIVNMDSDLVEQAGECGLRSVIILLGILDGLDYKIDILSYEGPFGVGYLVADLEVG